MKTARAEAGTWILICEQCQSSLLPILHPHMYSTGTWLSLCPRQLAQFTLEWSLFWPTLSLGIRTPSPTICPRARRTSQHLQQVPEVGLGHRPNLWQVAKGQSSVIHDLKDHRGSKSYRFHCLFCLEDGKDKLGKWRRWMSHKDEEKTSEGAKEG